ncbi:rCG41607 [Rattus norvegicus]|uniref:RCG41607 n=1 Tax=Rattus norvegicus TaxID=10116 RepID=A6IHE2_RAT|nr:rCG41607 [Rattus norvegicus]
MGHNESNTRRESHSTNCFHIEIGEVSY